MKKVWLMFLIVSCASLPDSRSEMSSLKKRPLKHQLKSFKSDGCSRWPEGTNEKPNLWLKCCFEHDISYWMGGTEDQRKKTDQSFQQCIDKVSSEFTSDIMYTGVRVGGTPAMDTDYKWGYGWNYDRGYISLNSSEKSYIKKQLPRVGSNLIDYLQLDTLGRPERLPKFIKVESYKMPQMSK